MKNFDVYVNELMNTLTDIAEQYGLLAAPDEEVQGYAERVRLRARLSGMSTLIHWMALDLAALDGIAEEARRVSARYESVLAARHLIDLLADSGTQVPQPIPVAPEPEEEEFARIRMTAIGVTPPDDMTYAQYAESLDGNGGEMIGSAAV